jgi:hypothetical protein
MLKILKRVEVELTLNVNSQNILYLGMDVLQELVTTTKLGNIGSRTESQYIMLLQALTVFFFFREHVNCVPYFYRRTESHIQELKLVVSNQSSQRPHTPPKLLGLDCF